VPDALKFMVSEPAVMEVTPILTSPPEAVMVGKTATKDHPAGGESTMELDPDGKSVAKPSVITILPSVVGDVATLLQILVPPEAVVIPTAADTE
jgi:hypothetical protein